MKMWLILLILEELMLKALFTNDTNRIWKGRVMDIGQFPYMVSIFISKKHSNTFCSGVFIHSKWILTTAHCFKEEEPILRVHIRYGVNNPFDEGNSKNIYLKVSESNKNLIYIIHPNFTENKYNILKHDVALIQLPHSIRLSKTVDIIRLEERPWLIENNNPSIRTCLAVGFGKSDDNNKQLLRARYIRTMYKTYCVCTPADPYYLCARNPKGGSIWNGDSGGPLICNNLLTGTPSTVRMCPPTIGIVNPTDPRAIIFFTYIYEHLAWIKQYADLDDRITLPRYRANNSNIKNQTFILLIFICLTFIILF